MEARTCNGCSRLFKSAKGRKIHQTKMSCGLTDETRPTTVDKSPGCPDQDINHSVRHGPYSEVEERRRAVKWPRSCDKQIWRGVEEDLCAAVNTIKGPAVRKIHVMGELVYEYGRQRFGVKQSKERNERPPVVSRRRRQIQELRREVRQIKARVRQNKEDRVALVTLLKELRERISRLGRAERHARSRKEREKARRKFMESPFQFAKQLFKEKASGVLDVGKEELESHLRNLYADPRKQDKVTPIEGLIRPSPPGVSIDLSAVKLKEVRDVIRKARTKSASGPNGVSYAVYKNCPKLVSSLWRILAKVWEVGEVPECWCKADGIYIPKEESAVGLDQFRPISLLNVEGKIFLAVFARRLTSYLTTNGYVDTSIQKAGIPAFPGCMEHIAMIWSRIKEAKRSRSELHVAWLDLANAYGSVPHRMIMFALDFFHVPCKFSSWLMSYFNLLAFRFTTSKYTTAFVQLHKGIAMGCVISPILFVMVMEVVLRGLHPEQRVQDGEVKIRAFMDDLTVIQVTEDGVKTVLSRLSELILWTGMSFKARKSRSLSLKSGKVVRKVFSIAGEAIPTVRDEKVKSLGRWYSMPVSDRHRGMDIQRMAFSGLTSIDSSMLPGKFKVWCMHFGLLPRLMWPLTIYDVAISRVEIIEMRVNKMIRKWLGVPKGLSLVALYSKRSKLQLPLVSLVEEFKVGKIRLQSMLLESKDHYIRDDPPELQSGQKWKVADAMVSTSEMLRFNEVCGVARAGRRGLGMEAISRVREQDKSAESRRLREIEMRNLEEESRLVMAAQQGQQGRWLNWEGVEQRVVSWDDWWKMSHYHLKFLLQCAYDVAASPANLKIWHLRDSSACDLCGEHGSLKHLLSGCKRALALGWYTFRHNLVLEEIRKALLDANIPERKHHAVDFVREGTVPTAKRTILRVQKRWTVLVDSVLPSEVVMSSQRPDLVLFDEDAKHVVLGELTVPWEEGIDEAHERKLLRYQNLVSESKERGYSCVLFPFEVGCRGFPAMSLRHFLRTVGVKDCNRVIKLASDKAVEGSAWILQQFRKR